MMKNLMLIMAIASAIGTLTSAHAGQMGWTLKQLRDHYGHELGGADGSSVEFKQGTFFFDPDGTVGTIEIWKQATNRYCQPFSDQEIEHYLHAASEITWTQTENTLQARTDSAVYTALHGHLKYVGSQNGKPVFEAIVGWDYKHYWMLDIHTIRQST
jgi:hypothetical protein